jgi:hypothetical protein
MVKVELTRGNVQEAFCYLKGWYRATLETWAKPCYHTLEHQTLERVDFYARRASPGDPLPINVAQVKINNDVPSNGSCVCVCVCVCLTFSRGGLPSDAVPTAR